MKKIITTSIFLALISLFLQAAPVSRPRAAEQAANFIQGARKSVQVQDLKCIYPVIGQMPSEYAPLYVFNLETPTGPGFVIMGGESDLTQILGYSLNRSFPEKEIPANLAAYLKHYESQITAYQEAVSKGSPRNAAPKQHPKADAEPVVAPLLENYAEGAIEYDQWWPYYNMCPDPDNMGRPTLTGCLATAMAQICRFYKYPESGTGSISYTWRSQEYSTDFNHPYDWNNTLCSYKEEKPYSDEELNAIAQLMMDCGYACEMEYGYYESVGRYMKMNYGAREYLGYNPGSCEAFKQMYTEQQWRDLIAGQLDQGMPVYHSGSYPNQNVGHAFVCDGYNEDNYFHFNWGWNGYANGWFLLNDLSAVPTGSTGDYDNGYNEYRRISLDLRPKREGDRPGNGLFYNYSSTDEKVFKCSRKMYGKEEAVNGTAAQIYNPGYDSVVCLQAVGVGFWQNGQCVKVLDTKPLCILSNKIGTVSFNFYPGKDLANGEYKMSVVSRRFEEDPWKEMPAAPGFIYAYKVVVQQDSVAVMCLDEAGNRPVIPPVRHVTAVAQQNTIKLEWEEPVESCEPVVLYKVLLDGELRGAIRKTQFSISDVPAGQHRVEISASYGTTDSDPVSVDITVGNAAVERGNEAGSELCRVYPNPIKEHFYVETVCAGVFQWIGMNGKVLREYKIGFGGTYGLEIPSLPSGVNVWRFESVSGQKVSGKIVVR